MIAWRKTGIICALLMAAVLLASTLACSKAPAPTTPPPPAKTTAPAPAPAPPKTTAAPAPAPAPAPAKTYDLKWAQVYAIDSPSYKNEHQIFVDRVAQLSNGRIQIKPVAAGVMGNANEYPSMIKSGVVDMAHLFMPSYADQWPLASAFGLPFLAKNYQQAFQLPRDLFETAPELVAYWEKGNVKPLTYSGGSSPVIQTVKPVRSVADLKGLKIRTSGGPDALILKAWGAVPVFLAAGDVYPALQNKVIDGTFTSATVQRNFRFYEVEKNFLVPAYLITTPVAMTATIRRDLWNSMSKADQDILDKAARERDEIVWKRWTTENADILKSMETDQKATVVYLNKAETDEMAKMAEQATKQWISDNPGSQPLVDRITAWIKQHPAQ